MSHRCIHDHPDIQQGIQQGLENSKANNNEAAARHAKQFHELAYAKMRIVISQDDLNDPLKYCTDVTQSRPKFDGTGGSLACSSTSLFTAAMKDALVNNILPAAILKLQDALSVDSVVGNLVVPSSSKCSEVTTPASHSSSGVSNADFILYVSAGPVSSEGTLAFATPCGFNAGSGRPLVGKANFNPRHLVWDSAATKNNQDQVDTAVHEILHAMGFTPSYWNRAPVSPLSGSRRGKTVNFFNTPKLVTEAQSYFNCSTASGPEIEDEGPGGSAGSHFDRRIIPQEIMTASGGTRLSRFTLAFLEDLGYYQVTYGKADSITVGKNLGCGFVDSKCNEAAGGKDVVFCFTPDLVGCTTDNMAVGTCSVTSYVADLPAYFQYFSDPKRGGPDFSDKCPATVGYSNRQCGYARTGATASELDSEEKLAFYFGSGGRCFNTDNLRKSTTVTAATGHRCIRSRCPAGGRRVEVFLDVWIACPLDGTTATITADGYTGSVFCPNATSFCSSEIVTGSSSRGTKPIGTSDLPINAGSNLVTGEVTINATRWSGILLTDRSKTDLSNSLRIDLAFFLGVDTTSLRIRKMRISTEGFFLVRIAVVSDGLSGLTPSSVKSALEKSDGSFLTDTNAAYRAYNGGSDKTVVVAFTVDKLYLGSACGASITPDNCALIMAVCIAVGVMVILLILSYCLCCRSPFGDDPPFPSGTKRDFTPGKQ